MLPYFPPKPVPAKFNLTMIQYSHIRPLTEDTKTPLHPKAAPIKGKGKPIDLPSMGQLKRKRNVAHLQVKRHDDAALAAKRAFAGGTLTVSQLAKILNISPNTAGARFHYWRGKGLCHEVGMTEKPENYAPVKKGRGVQWRSEKIWALTPSPAAVPTSANSQAQATQTAGS